MKEAKTFVDVANETVNRLEEQHMAMLVCKLAYFIANDYDDTEIIEVEDAIEAEKVRLNRGRD